MCRAGRCVEGEAAEDEDGSEGEEGEVPAEWGANVVADVVDGEDVVVDNAFDEVEGAPAHQDQPDLLACNCSFSRRAWRWSR